MKHLLLATIAACALATAIPTLSASAMTPTSLATVAAGGDDAVVLVKHGGGRGRGHMGRGGRGHHYGWSRGRHRGWR